MTINDLDIRSSVFAGRERQRVSYRGHLLVVLEQVPRSNKWIITRATIRCVHSWAECVAIGALEWTDMLEAIIELTIGTRL